MSYENLYSILRIGEPHLDSANDYEILGEEFMDCCYWDEEIKGTMNQAVISRDGLKELEFCEWAR